LCCFPFVKTREYLNITVKPLVPYKRAGNAACIENVHKYEKSSYEFYSYLLIYIRGLKFTAEWFLLHSLTLNWKFLQ
jgi:hypothetical protein